MNNLSRIMPFSVLIVLLLSVFPCCDRISTTQIKQILDNPRQFSEKEVTVKGQVVDTFSIFVVKYFSIKDESGEMTVVTNKPLPKKGEIIKVTGKVQEAFSLGTETLLVIIENEK